MTAIKPPAGWYPDPNDPSAKRWWDGTSWGPAAPPPQPTPVPVRAASGPGCGTGCLVIIGVIIVIAVIAGISSAISAGNSNSRSSGSSRSSVSSVTPEERLVQQLRSSKFDYSTVTDAELIAGAKQYCSNIDNSENPKAAIMALIVEASASAYPRETSYLVGAAVASVCPEHGADFKAVTQQ